MSEETPKGMGGIKPAIWHGPNGEHCDECGCGIGHYKGCSQHSGRTGAETVRNKREDPGEDD